MDNSVILYCASGHCKVIIDILECLQVGIQTIVDDNLMTTSIMENSVVHTSNFSFTLKDSVILSIGNNKIRKKLSEQLKVTFEKVIHPNATVSKHSKIEEGTVIMHHVLVNANAKIGKNCIINTKALIEHDCIVEDNCHISTASIINGGVIVKNDSFVGSNSTSKQSIEISGFIKAGSLAK